MPFPLDTRILPLLSVFDDRSFVDSDRYCRDTPWRHQRYVRHARGGDLVVTVWSLPGTRWVTLEGLLDRRANPSLAAVLMQGDALDLVLHVAGLELVSPSGGTPLVALCATLSCAGYSVTVVGRDDDPTARSDDRYGDQVWRSDADRDSA